MSKLIIGIHGLANKSKRPVLEGWWKSAIAEGLKANCAVTKRFDYYMVYWADLLYKNPLHDDPNFKFDKLYNDQPYIKAKPKDLKEYKDGWTDDARRAAGEIAGGTLDKIKQWFGIDFLADKVIEKVTRDLDFYYDDKRKIKNRKGQLELARKVLRDELKTILLKFKDRELMLIAHSMGSIIAYDVLRDLGHDGTPLKIHSLVTIGSPLGLPHVKGKIIHERTYIKRPKDRVRTPTIVTDQWVNYADRKDPVALDTHLSDDYKPNDLGVQVRDDIIINDYKTPKGKRNHHKSYGYLRTPEISALIADFIK